MRKSRLKRHKARFAILLTWKRRNIHNLLHIKQHWESKLRRKNIGISLVILFVFVFAGGYIFHSSFASTPSETKTEKQYAVLPPISIRIPSLGVKTEIESVAKDKEGRMDVPKDVMGTAWYNRGSKPGEIGNAVIAGHLTTPTGKPAVFYKLNTMKKGDAIEVEDAGGTIYIYRVVEITSYPLEKFPIELVFGSNKKKRLNLITCSGSFNKTADTYSERTVVFSELEKKMNSTVSLTNHVALLLFE